MRTLWGSAKLMSIESLSLHLSLKNYLKTSNKEIGSACSFVKFWVRDCLLYVAIVNINLIHQTVDLKYVLSTQVVRIEYEGRMHLFSVTTVSTKKQNARTPDSDISESLGTLSMNDIARLYIVDWDTAVAIEDNVQVPESKSSSVNDLLSLHSLLYLTMWISSPWGFPTGSKALMPTQLSEDLMSKSLKFVTSSTSLSGDPTCSTTFVSPNESGKGCPARAYL